VDPSSLIFLAIIAIWAAYLLGHWVRRRDQIATARSIDRFSEAMRVLERRTPTRPVTAARPTARAYVVAPVRVPVAAGRRPPTSRTAAPEGSRGVAHVRITRDAARRRARLLLGLGVATVVAWLLAVATPVAWWPAAAVTLLLASVLVQLRRTARPAQARAHGPVARARPRSAGRRRTVASRVPVPARRARGPRHERSRRQDSGSRPARGPRQDVRAILDQVHGVRAAGTGAVATADLAVGAVVADMVVAGAVVTSDGGAGLAHDVRSELSARPDHDTIAEGSWQPVPVPPPTYTLKPKARPAVRRPVVDDLGDRDDRDDLGVSAAVASQDESASAPIAPAASTAPPAAAAPAFDLDEILERRIAANE
jgi:hypothetical protein